MLLVLLLTATAAGCTRPSGSPPAAASTIDASSPRAIVSASLRALGAPITGPSFEVTLESRQARGNPNQARRWNDSTPFLVPTVLRYVVDVTARRAMYELRSPAPGDIWFHYLTRYDTAGAWQVDLMRWRVGDDIARASAAAGASALAAAERQMPHALLQQAARSGELLRALPPRERDGRRVLALEYPDPATRSAVTVEIDALSQLPVAVTTSGPGGATTLFNDYRTARGIRVPYARVTIAGGATLNTQRVTALSLSPELGEARFAVPAGYTDPPRAGAPRATRVAGALYRLDDMPGGYHAAFVVGDSGVIVLEAPQTAAYTEAALRVIEATAPGKPVTHVLVTHHHNDHVGGLAPYVARGAALVVGAGLEEAVRRQLPDSLRARARFEGVASRRTIGRGDARVDAIPVANEHADGNVAYHVPAARALFQGDLFYIPERGAVPPAFPVTAAMVRALRDAGVTVDHVIGVHGRTGSWSEVERSLALAAGRPFRPTP